MIGKLLTKLTCSNGKMLCLYTMLTLIALINSIIISIERYMCKEPDCDNKYTRGWFIISIVGSVCALLFILLLVLVKLLRKKPLKVSHNLILSFLLLYVCFVSLDKLYNYEHVFTKMTYISSVRMGNIIVSLIISILLLRKLCNC